MPAVSYDRLFKEIETLVMYHSPSGVEGEIDEFLLYRLRECGHEVIQDPAGNIIVKVSGRNEGAIAVTAHKDEIGAIVKTVRADG
nr:M42 family peptidase [Pseudomonadota bacterium]